MFSYTNFTFKFFSINVQDCVTITTNTKFILVSWDVARPGLWYDIEVFGTRSQFKTIERTWPQGVKVLQNILQLATKMSRILGRNYVFNR